MLPSGSIGGPECSLRYSALRRRDNSKCVCRGCYFYAGMPDPIPSAHLSLSFFFLSDPDYFLACPSPPIPSRPARPIQLIFSQSKYESTKKSIYHASESSLLFFCDGGNSGLHMPVILLKPRLSSALLLSSFSPREDVVLSLLSGH